MQIEITQGETEITKKKLLIVNLTKKKRNANYMLNAHIINTT